jgi:hypothetical protein
MNYSNTSRRNFLTSTLLAGAGIMVGAEAASRNVVALSEDSYGNF